MPQRVRVPLRVVVGHYADATVSVYVKIAALDRRDSGCEAGVAYLSGLLGLARSTVERALTQLMRPAPDDDIVELTSQRRTRQGGEGWTAVRRVRATNPQREHGAWVPSRAAESLSPRQLRCYAALAYATATGVHATLAELARVLRHRSGQKAGQPLAVRSVRRILRDLEQLGWITVEPRAGYRGRHIYTVHDEPVQAVLTADSGEGSGGDLGEGSLTVDHHQTDSPDDQPPTAALDFRRRREQVVAGGPVENPPLPAAVRRPYGGPQLSLAPRIWRVLEPVKTLLPGLSPYVVRELAREIGRQLDEGQEVERLRSRLEFRFASTDTIRDPGRWLLGAGIVRRGCGLAACESGLIWHTGRLCSSCVATWSSAERLRRIERELDQRERDMGIRTPYQLPPGRPQPSALPMGRRR
ncbi:hypothetical protein [Streptomyces cylindrosporus]|uniref:Helix-turn-helix domain-containing protein n=1 Tax=Streptomyces cylindrosporus TaxID=2927583 RepID=A0ABS9YJX3_9ACTN|nr:hypothetical protein [Streptomyces cylindrosporus]MCI3277470.1 hypothetical protein [Streptomyces cylindrosporus]